MLTAVVISAERLGNVTYRLSFVVDQSLAVDILLGTFFIDTLVGSIDVVSQRLELRRGGAVAIADAKGVAASTGKEG